MSCGYFSPVSLAPTHRPREQGEIGPTRQPTSRSSRPTWGGCPKTSIYSSDFDNPQPLAACPIGLWLAQQLGGASTGHGFPGRLLSLPRVRQCSWSPMTLVTVGGVPTCSCGMRPVDVGHSACICLEESPRLAASKGRLGWLPKWPPRPTTTWATQRLPKWSPRPAGSDARPALSTVNSATFRPDGVSAI